MWIIWPFRKKNFGSARNIVTDFERLVESSDAGYVIRDEKLLPHSKSDILEAICVLLHQKSDQEAVEALRMNAFELSFFLKGVGDRPLHPLGAQSKDRGKTDPSGKERYDRFKSARDEDWKRMQAVIDRATQSAT